MPVGRVIVFVFERRSKWVKKCQRWPLYIYCIPQLVPVFVVDWLVYALRGKVLIRYSQIVVDEVNLDSSGHWKTARIYIRTISTENVDAHLLAGGPRVET